MVYALAAGNNGNMWPAIITVVGVVAILYFLIVRPQRKQEKEAAEMRSSIKAGDAVVTIGGIIGTVVVIRNDKMIIETGNNNNQITILVSAVKNVITDEEES